MARKAAVKVNRKGVKLTTEHYIYRDSRALTPEEAGEWYREEYRQAKEQLPAQRGPEPRRRSRHGQLERDLIWMSCTVDR